MSAHASAWRGQTSLDFVIAIAVFLLAVTFSFAFVSGLLGPFTQDQSADAVADRTVDALVDDLAEDVTQPRHLNDTCTAAFFTRTGGADCPFDASATLAQQAGVSDSYQVNVTLDGPTVHRQVGTALPASGSTVATARRSVVVDDRIAVLEVRVWA